MDSPTDLHEQQRLIKRALHAMMNGPVSASMREKGLTYKVNFGVELPRLQAYAQELPHTYELAATLWKEDIRECRLLAGMLMPPERMDADLADLWVEQMRFSEEAENTVMHLFTRCPWAAGKAFEWIASDDAMHQQCGYLILARLFMKGMRPSERDEVELLDQVEATLADTTAPHAVRQAAHKALMKWMDLGEDEARRGDALLDRLGL